MRLRLLLLLLLPTLALTPSPARAQDLERGVTKTIRREFARLQDQQRDVQQPDPNINAKYVIEKAEIRGLAPRDQQPFDDDLRALVGRRLDSPEVHALETRLREALREYVVLRRSARGTEPGRIRLIFEVRRADWSRWIRFEPTDANVIFHSDQGWGAKLPLSISSGNLLISPFFAFDVGDELVEEYSGWGIRVDTRQLGSERLGASFEYSSYEMDWREPTLTALALDPGIPAAYEKRRSVTPALRFGITRELTLSGGVRITELDALPEAGGESRMANAVLASLTFARSPRETERDGKADRDARGDRHGVNAGFVVRTGLAGLESDFVYERYVVYAGYSFRRAHQAVIATGMAGRIEGDAPLFERFSIGDSRTLRGWNKYDLAPAGGDRVFHASLEYRYRAFGMFLDTGSVWTRDTARRLRTSAGLTFNPGPVFMTVGFPLNTSEFGAVFTMGVRFSSARIGFNNY
jgi:hypothetical protein